MNTDQKSILKSVQEHLHVKDLERTLRKKEQRPKIIATVLGLIIIATTLAYANFYNDRHGSEAAPGTLTVSVNQKSGTADPNPSYTSVFTVVFSEAINADTFTSGDITLAGTAPGQTVQSITEAESFNKTTYEVRIAAAGAGTITPSIGQELVTAANGASGTNHASTSTDNSVTYNGTWAPGEFVTTWKTDNPGVSGSNQITIPTTGGGYNYTVNWGDGNTSTGQTGNATHTYASAGTYTVSITGTFPRIQFNNNGDRQKILSVEQWSTNAWTSMEYAFMGCANLSITAIDAPDLSSLTSLDTMFMNSTNLNSSLNHWNVSHITNMQSVFQAATSFNQPLNNWDVSGVTNMTNIFSGASAFNQPLNNWNVGNVTNMGGAFQGATSFNQPLNNWNTGNVTSISIMFAGASTFNQSLNNWDTSHVTNMGGAFQGATSFNQPLNNWNTGNVTDMGTLFYGASSFDQPLNSWNTGNVTLMWRVFYDASSFNHPLSNWNASSVTDMREMFNGATVFNQPLNAWNVSQVTNMSQMFSNTGAFNQPLNNWHVSNVVDMSGMFESATAFNQPLDDWNTGSVTNMSYMFGSYSPFNQSLGSWDVSHVTNMSGMFSSPAGFSTANYDSTLIGWSTQSLQNNVLFTAGASRYCTAATQRQNIITSHNWSINDFGQRCGAPSPTPTPTVSPTVTPTPGPAPTHHITNCQEFQAISINPVTFEFGDTSANYVLDNDIDCSETATWTWDGFAPPGAGTIGWLGFFSWMEGEGFSGTLDGQGHTVLNIYQGAYSMPGVFYGSQGATIKNITIDGLSYDNRNASVDLGSGPIGGFITLAIDTVIQNVHIRNLNLSVLDSKHEVGGLIGRDRSAYDAGSQNGNVLTIENSSVTGSITVDPDDASAYFHYAGGVVSSPNGNLYIVDSGNNRIQVIDASGKFMNKWGANDGNGSSGTGNGEFSTPQDIVRGNDGYIYVLEPNRVQKFDSSGNYLSQFGGGDLSAAQGITMDTSGNFYITDHSQIKKFSSNGVLLTQWGSSGSGNGQFQYAGGIGVNSSGQVYVADVNNNRIQKFDSSGTYLSQFGELGSGNGQFQSAQDLAINSNDEIYVADMSNHRVQKFDNNGQYITQWGDYSGMPGQLSYPRHISIDSSGNIFVTDQEHAIQKFNSNGVFLSELGLEGSANEHTGDDPSGLYVSGMITAYSDDPTPNFLLRESYSDVNIAINTALESRAPSTIHAGGLTAFGFANIDNSYAAGSIYINNSSSDPSTEGIIVGGLSGLSGGLITNSYSSNSLVVDDPYSSFLVGGGLAGQWMAVIVDGQTMDSADITNSFSTSHINMGDPNQVSGALHSLVGFSEGLEDPQGPGQGGHIVNSYFDQYRTGLEVCARDAYGDPLGTSSCTPINPTGLEPNYFINNHTNPPMNVWGFQDIWRTRLTTYPDFIGENAQTPTPSPTPTSTPPLTPTPGGNTPAPTPSTGTPVKSPRTSTSTTSPTTGPTSSVSPLLTPFAGGAINGSNTNGRGSGNNTTTPAPTKVNDGFGFGERVRGIVGALGANAVYGQASLIILLILLACFYLYQSWQEHQAQVKLEQLIARLQLTKQLRSDFLNIVSHYLNTPIQIMSGGLELARDQLPDLRTTTQALAVSLSILSDDIRELLKQTSGVDQASHTTTPTINVREVPHLWKQSGVWVPVVSTIILLILFNIIVLATAQAGFNPYTTGIILCFFVASVFFVVFAYRARWHLRTLGQETQSILNDERRLDQDRMRFIAATAKTLRGHIAALKAPAEKLIATGKVPAFANGLGMMVETSGKFERIQAISTVSVGVTQTAITPWMTQNLPEIEKYVKSAGLSFTAQVDLNISSPLDADTLSQLVGSLISNAVKFTQAGGTVTLKLLSQKQGVLLIVQDTGAGIEPEKLKALFQPFTRGTDVLSYDYEGIGLSLYINQLIVARVGGSIDISSKPGRGTKVTVKLPTTKI